LDSSVVLDYNSYSSYKFDFRLDPIEPEPDYSSGSYEEKLLLGHAASLVIKSTPAGRLIYWPGQKPADLTSTIIHAASLASRHFPSRRELRCLPLQRSTP
jgi:hypothetical protein